MFIKKYGDLTIGIFFSVLSIAMILASIALPKSTVMEIGPDFVPLCIAILTLGLAAALIVLSLKQMKKNAGIEIAVDPSEEAPDMKRVIISFLLILIYVFIMKPVGFIVSTCVYLPLQMLVLAPDEGRKPVFLTIISVLFTFAVFFLFRYGFKIVLPAGIFTINL